MEAGSVEHDLCNEECVGHDHRDVSEQRLQVIWQLSATEEERVHRDEQSTVSLENNSSALNNNLFELLVFPFLNQNDQLRNDRKHVNLQSVELVKANPCATRCKTLEEF